MQCPHCCSAKTTERSDRTMHGYRRFRCRGCGRGFNERTGSVLNRLQLPTDVVFLVVFWRPRYKLSLRDLAEVLLVRGTVFTHEACRIGKPGWVLGGFAPAIDFADSVRRYPPGH